MSIEALVFPDISLDAGVEPAPGPVRLGSEEHKNLFCRMLLTTHDPYRPAVIDWPRLKPGSLARLTSLDIGAEKTQDNNFTVNGAKELGIDISVSQLMDTCLSENDRRRGVYDPRLARPMFVPRMVRFARRFMRNPKPASP